MRLRLTGLEGKALRRRFRLLPFLVLLAAVAVLSATASAADAPPTPPATEAAPAAGAGMTMNSAGWLEHIVVGLEREAMSDISMLPDTPSALAREWRSFDRDGSAMGALIGVGWVVLAAGIALFAERLASHGLSRRLRRSLRTRLQGPTLVDLLLLLLCDAIGLAVFAGVFVYSRHWLAGVGVTQTLAVLSASVLIRWRTLMLIPRVVLRPREPVARLIDIPDGEARRLVWFLSAVLLAISILVGFGRYGLSDEDSGAPHIIGLVVAAAVCGLDAWIVIRARGAIEALIRGRRSDGIIAAMRGALARAWVTIGLTLVGALMLFFVFGLSLGLLSYYHAAGIHQLVARSFRRILRAVVLLVAAMTLVSIWVDAIDPSPAAAAQATHSAAMAVGTLFAAYLAWELVRLAIDRNLQDVPGGPKLPGSADDDEESTPASRLQTVLPMTRAFVGVAVGVVAVLIVLSRLGVDTAPLIAGAGVFGLAVSFGSQSLVRDIISGLFYMWDDAFRVGEYIDTARHALGKAAPSQRPLAHDPLWPARRGDQSEP